MLRLRITTEQGQFSDVPVAPSFSCHAAFQVVTFCHALHLSAHFSGASSLQCFHAAKKAHPPPHSGAYLITASMSFTLPYVLLFIFAAYVVVAVNFNLWLIQFQIEAMRRQMSAATVFDRGESGVSALADLIAFSKLPSITQMQVRSSNCEKHSMVSFFNI